MRSFTGEPDYRDDRVVRLLVDFLADGSRASFVFGDFRLGQRFLAQRLTDYADVVLPRRTGCLGEDGGRDCGELLVVLPVADLGGDDEVRLQCGDLLEACTADRADRDASAANSSREDPR